MARDGSPGVTILMPFRNARSTLELALRSIFAQTYPAWEAILIDDGSDDNSYEIAASLADGRVTVLRDGRQRGLAARLNEGMTAVDTPYVCRMDADDIMLPSRLERSVRAIEASGADLLAGAAYVMDDKLAVYGIIESRYPKSPFQALLHSWLIHPTVLGRTNWFRRHPYSLAFPGSEDHELWCRTFFDTRLALIPTPLIYYRRPRRQSLRKFWRAYASDVRIAFIHGPRMVGPGGAALALGVLTARMIVRTATWLALAGSTPSGGIRPPTVEELRSADLHLRRIMQPSS
ncbi:MAG: glycosyltransferase family 2 protein [Chloroflexi bacterium]|nr:glycosyltransferase family 2 protein [Chloroflexota bacterium]